MHRDLCKCMSGIMRHIEIIQIHGDDASDKAIKTEAEIEVDV